MLDKNKIKVPQDVFDLAEERLLSSAHQFKGKNFRCQFDIKGQSGGQWFIVINDKQKRVGQGTIKQPVGTLITEAADFLKLVRGELNIGMAFLMGQIKVKGDPQHIIQLAETLLS